MNCKLCSYFYNDKNRIPKLIQECGDTFCLTCINQMRRCHQCRKQFDRTKCITNNELLKAVMSTKKGREFDLKINICFGGSIDVGKTSVIKRLQGQDFTSVPNTVAADFFFIQKKLAGCTVQLHILDPAGQEKFGALTRQFYRKCDIFVFVYDLSADSNSNKLDYWIQQAKEYCPKETIKILVGNKKDKIEDVNPDHLNPLNFSNNQKMIGMKAETVQVSCKTFQGFQELWQILDLHVIQQIEKKQRKSKTEINGQKAEEKRAQELQRQQERQRELVRLRNENREHQQRRKRCSC